MAWWGIYWLIDGKLTLDEARAGFEPANQGFADPAIGPLWYRAIIIIDYNMITGAHQPT